MDKLEDKIVVNMFKFGPLHEDRFKITKDLTNLPIQTGDILYRASDAKGPLGLPFSQLVARITHSKYSHAAIVLIDHGNPYVLEINDQGTLLYRLIDWLDTCFNKNFAVYRLKEIDDTLKDNIEVKIRQILEDDPDYNFTFSDPEKYYCTESIARIYQRVGIKLVEPDLIKDIVPNYLYYILRIGSGFMSLIYTTSLPFNVGLYYVGNETKGLISSDKTYSVYDHESK